MKEDNPNFQDWVTFSNESLPYDDVRKPAWDRLATRRGGWCSRHPLTLMDYAVAFADAYINRTVSQRGLRSTSMCPHDIAVDAIILLHDKPGSVKEGPRRFLCGAIKILVRRGIEKDYPNLSAKPLEEVPEPAIEDHQGDDPADAEDGGGQTSRRTVRRAIRQLPRKYRQVIFSYYYLNMGCREGAARLGISHENFRQRLVRAREMIEDTLRGEEPGLSPI